MGGRTTLAASERCTWPLGSSGRLKARRQRGLLRAARADGEGGYVRCEQKAEGGRVEAAAFTPDDERMRVESAYAWPRLVRYVVVLEYDELRDVAILIKQETRRRTAREEPRRYAGTPPEHAAMRPPAGSTQEATSRRTRDNHAAPRRRIPAPGDADEAAQPPPTRGPRRMQRRGAGA